jgi:hypothetical protein
MPSAQQSSGLLSARRAAGVGALRFGVILVLAQHVAVALHASDEPRWPFNFILSCHVRKLGYPIGVDPEKFHLIAPYETDPRKWEAMQWIDQYSQPVKRYRITASGPHGSRRVARVKNYGDVLREYEYHPETKCADASGAPCGKQTAGLLGRRHIAMDGFVYIGKESNKLEQVEEGGVPAESDVYTIYGDPGRDEWETKWLPMLRLTDVPELEAARVSRATIYAARAGRPLYDSTKAKLVAALRRSEQLKRQDT